MFAKLFATNYEIKGDICRIDGVIQSSTTPCDDALKGILGLIIAILLPLLFISLIFLVFWIITLVHAIKNLDVPNRVLWIVLHVVAFFVGLLWAVTIVYYFAVMRPYKKAKSVELSNPEGPTQQNQNQS